RSDLIKRIAARQDVQMECVIGAGLIEQAAERAEGEDAAHLHQWARMLREEKDAESRQAIALGKELAAFVERYPDRRFASRYEKELSVVVDREKAGYSAWYELYPRSCSPERGRHGTLRDCEAWLPYIAWMGFDVLYLPPIH